MTILITGGAGFIGSHLAECYLNRGECVYVLDNLSTSSLSNVEHLRQQFPPEQFIIHIDSVFNSTVVDNLVKTCDTVFHLAAAVGVQHVMASPTMAMKTNIEGTEKVLHACSRYGKKLILASTSEVYGKHLHAPLKENDNILYGPVQKLRWSYAASKLINEFMTLDCHQATGLETIVVRLFNTVGPRQTGAYGMVFPRLTRQALDNAPLTVYGNGQQSRTFTSVHDTIHALMLLAETDEAIGEVVNVGGSKEISILELGRKIIQITGSKSTIDLIPYQDVFAQGFDDIQRRVPCVKKLQQLIGFTPKTDIDILVRLVANDLSAKQEPGTADDVSPL